MAVYFVLKFVVWVALRIFFKKFQIHNRRYLAASAPLIVVGNHPNTFMDPLIAAVLVPKRVAFIANGGIFNEFTRPILRFFHIIPIYRGKDMPTVNPESSQKELNNKTFEHCFDYLAEGGKIVIFPEGTSELERRLRQIKTGTARIALGAEAEHNFELGVKILPLGFNYSDPTRFRSDVFINVSEPIEVKSFENLYKIDPFEAVEQLTNKIEEAFVATTIVTEDAQEDELVKNIEILYKNRLFDQLNLNEDDKKHDFILIRSIIDWIRNLEKTNLDNYNKLETNIENYLESLKTLGLSDYVFVSSRKLYQRILKVTTGLIIGLPFYIYGLITNYLPYILPSKICNAITKDLTYRGPMMMSVGVFTFPLFYGLQIWAVQRWLQTGWLTVLFAFSLPLAGFFVIRYWGLLQILAQSWQGLRLLVTRPSIMKTLAKQRQQIFEQLP